MLCKKHPPMRNLINLSNPRQVRTLKKRLGVSGAELARVVEKGREFDCRDYQGSRVGPATFRRSNRLRVRTD